MSVCTCFSFGSFVTQTFTLQFSLLLFVCACVPPRHTQLPSGSMKILETRVSDSGLYVCVASNIAGNLTQSIELSVLGKFRDDKYK